MSAKLLTAFIAAALVTTACADPAASPVHPTAHTMTAPASLTFDLPKDWISSTDGDNIVIKIAHFNDVIIRPAVGAKTPADVVDALPKIIVTEVTGFKQTAAHDIKIAGNPAKHVMGTGKEADDGDPSNTEVFVFSIGDKVYTACVHGEGMDAEKLRPDVAKLLDSAKAAK